LNSASKNEPKSIGNSLRG